MKHVNFGIIFSFLKILDDSYISPGQIWLAPRNRVKSIASQLDDIEE